jgi:hypothetical protein
MAKKPEIEPDDERLVADLACDIREQRVILFAGAGLSAGLGLPSWEEFIGRLGSELGFDPETYLSLSPDFRSLAEYYCLERGSLDGLRERMVRDWAVSDAKLAASDVYRRIVQLGFPLIYTTNYDDLLERAFELHGVPFNKVTSAKDIASCEPNVATIVKFHGDLEEGSLVLTETDYFRRLGFDEPLDIQLMAHALGRGILFLGYSASDVNLRLLLFRLRQIWSDRGAGKSRPRSYIVMTRPDRIQQRILDSWGVIPLVTRRGEPEDEAGALVSFLERLARQSSRRLAQRNTQSTRRA